MKILLDRRLTRLVKFVTIDPSELHGFFKTKRAPQIHMLDTLAMSFKELLFLYSLAMLLGLADKFDLRVIFANLII